ncbi:MAG: sulfite exporter TauE/SafE family protein [Ideonella sp.]|nr:sulfite exporter TauE/SafE family protein [Ideonella sp.]MCC7457715.1 sulfite exporter TauE/SafE family protein [Nitrospira sp.]
MDLALLLTAALMGVAGTPHCAAMCGAACVAAGGGTRGWPMVGFQLGRLLSYATVGAVAAGSVQLLGRLGQWTPPIRLLWVAVHVAALLLGLWLLVRAAQPLWVQQLAPFRAGAATGAAGAPVVLTWGRRLGGGARSGVAGLLWAAWPCGLLHSALMVAALANGAGGGAAVMAAFALASSLGLLAAPWLLGVLARDAGERSRRWMTRIAGGLLVGASLWALGHGLWQRIVAWCFG